jgi:hypothetical protein
MAKMNIPVFFPNSLCIGIWLICLGIHALYDEFTHPIGIPSGLGTLS